MEPHALAGHFSLLPYWAFGLVVAGAFYRGMIWIGGHFSPGFRQGLTDWLGGRREASWADTFCTLFDTLFHHRHLSLRRLSRSAIASVLAVAALYVLFAHVLGVWHTRTIGRLEIWQALAALVAVNILADYVSLIETRWLLERFRHVRAFAAQAMMLLADLVFTGAIALALVLVYSHLLLGEAPRAIDVLALFSVYSIFFYSTFFTSIWAWLYCASAWFLRLFTHLGLGRVFDVEKEPVKQIALVGAGLIVLGSLALGPLVRAEAGGGTALDRALCRVDLHSCFLAARASLVGGDVAPTRLFVENACRAEETDGSCAERLFDLLRGDQEAANEIWRRACEGGYARACRAAGYAHDHGLGMREPDHARAVAFSRQACDGGDAAGCTNLGTLYEHGRGVDPDPARAVAFYRQGCDGGNAAGCANLGTMYSRGLGVEVDLGRAVAFYRRGCDGGMARACTNLGVMYEYGRGVELDHGRAVALYRQECDRGDATGCTNLGVMYEHGRGVKPDLGRAVELYRQGCAGGDARGCANLGFMYEHGRGVETEAGAAVALYRQGCDGGVARACTNLERMQAD
jgi:TPR repeat protein